jgi:predicted nucleic acid-binding protein
LVRLPSSCYRLVKSGEAQLMGSMRQEILSGIREEAQFRRIRDHLREFPNVSLEIADYEEAAQLSKRCRAAGVASSLIDMLMCAVSLRRRWQVFTTDQDFVHYRKVAPGMALLAVVV